jgi:hypothetical protein
MRRGAALALAAALAAGCGSDDRLSAARKDAPPPQPPARTVHFKASDGRPVTAEFTAAGAGAPAVVLLHEIRGGPEQWEPLVPYLHEAGFATLAYMSRASVMERDRIRDALGALRWLRSRPDVDRRRLALVGASIGASTTVFAMAAGPGHTVDAAVALSPPDSPDIWALQDHGRYRPHDLLMVSDERESTAVDGMMEGAVRSKALRSERPGHGVALLAQPAVRAAVVRWLRERVR